MDTETKWKWFKRFITLITLISGVLTGIGIFHQDLTLFAVSTTLALVTILLQIVIGFIDAMSNDPWLLNLMLNVTPKCPECGKPMKLKFIPRPGGPPGNMFVCDCEEGS